MSAGHFPLTQWSDISRLQNDAEASALGALDRLARLYWKPLQAFALSKGLGHHASEDVVQGFFGHICSRQILHSVEKRETKFRTFLLSVFTNWLTDERRRALAFKRGGQAIHQPLETETHDGTVEMILPASEEASITEFDRNWARTLFDLAKERLIDEVAQGHDPAVGKRILNRLFLTKPDWEAVAHESGIPHEVVRKRAIRLRQRFAVILRQQVRSVVSTDAEVAEELSYILTCLSSP